MKKKNQKIIIVSFMFLILFGIFYFSTMQTMWTNYEIVPLHYSGTIDSLGYSNPTAYIVDGSSNCGGRQKNWELYYGGCKNDYSKIELKKYTICVKRTIKNINSAKIKFSGTVSILNNHHGGRYYRSSSIKFYKNKTDQIGAYKNVIRVYSNGYRGTNIFNTFIDLDMKDYNLLGKKCFNIFIMNPTRSGSVTDTKFNYKITEADIDYNPVECSINSDCKSYEYCTKNYTCDQLPHSDIYRLENNKCVKYNIQTNLINSSDYKSLNNCQNNILVATLLFDNSSNTTTKCLNSSDCVCNNQALCESNICYCLSKKSFMKIIYDYTKDNLMCIILTTIGIFGFAYFMHKKNINNIYKG